MSDGIRGTAHANSAAEHLRFELSRISSELATGTLRPSVTAPPAGNAPFGEALRDIVAATPATAWPRLAVSFNEDQVESKLWLLENLPEAADVSKHRVVILGAWYGLLAMMLDQLMPRPPAEVLCIDIDEGTCALAKHLLSILSVPAIVQQADMMQIDYAELGDGRPTIVVNTSCEHLQDFAGWRARVPRGTRLVLQSNDHVGCPEHVSCVPDLAAFEHQARLSEVDYRGTLPLRRFKRFMLMGTA